MEIEMEIEIKNDFLKKLNEEQLQIIYDNSFLKQKSAVCIIACAGSGKTTTIIAKIVDMIKNFNCNPSHFFITTFTRNATSEIKSRLKEYLSDDEILKITIGTFHSIAYKNVNQYSNNKQLIEDHIEKFLYDYEKLLDDKDYKEEQQHKYIFIDEYQDINSIQEKIIRKLYENALLLVTVGDDQQNIYTFRNTNIKYILEFTNNYINSKYYYLTKNYRSQQNIITLANIVLKYNENKLDKELIAINTDKKKIKILNFPNQYQEINYFVNQIEKKLVTKTIQLHNIAIISRNNSTLQKIECALTEKNIPTYYLETIQDNTIVRENIQKIKNKIILSTIHGTKGLEFKNVFILDLKEGVFPSTLSSEEEERRLLYVGITRAKNNLILCYTENKPSRFLYEIMADEKIKDIIEIHSLPEQNMGELYKLPEIYSVTNIISNLTHEDFEHIRINFFDYKTILPDIKILHEEIPKHFFEILNEKNLLISNIYNVFGNFMETFITRTILQKYNIEIDNHDYMMMCLSEMKYYIDKLQEPLIKEYLDKIFNTKISTYSLEKINRIKNYFDSGIEIKGKINKIIIKHFIDTFKLYCSVINSSNCIFEIFIISLIKNITKGRTSLQYLINFKKEDNLKKINKSDFDIYTEWFKSIEKACNFFIDNVISIQEQFCIRDDETHVKGIFDLLIDDTIIEIKAYSDPKPKIEMLIQLLIYVALAKRKNITINKIKLYNPIHGHLYSWNISSWNKHTELMDFLASKIH